MAQTHAGISSGALTKLLDSENAHDLLSVDVIRRACGWLPNTAEDQYILVVVDAPRPLPATLLGDALPVALWKLRSRPG